MFSAHNGQIIEMNPDNSKYWGKQTAFVVILKDPLWKKLIWLNGLKRYWSCSYSCFNMVPQSNV